MLVFANLHSRGLVPAGVRALRDAMPYEGLCILPILCLCKQPETADLPASSPNRQEAFLNNLCSDMDYFAALGLLSVGKWGEVSGFRACGCLPEPRGTHIGSPYGTELSPGAFCEAVTARMGNRIAALH